MNQLSAMRSADESGVSGNERLTALAGSILLVLLLIELLSVVSLRALMSIHVAVGIGLAMPLTVKLASTGYRFVRYYTGSAGYVKRGPPSLRFGCWPPCSWRSR